MNKMSKDPMVWELQTSQLIHYYQRQYLMLERSRDLLLGKSNQGNRNLNYSLSVMIRSWFILIDGHNADSWGCGG